MEISGIIAAVLWSITSLLVMIQYVPACKNLNWQEQVIVGIVFIIGGPIFAAANVLEAILDCILPEGWGEDGPG